MFTRFWRADHIPVPDIAVYVVVPYQCTIVGMLLGANPKDQAVRDLALIYFST